MRKIESISHPEIEPMMVGGAQQIRTIDHLAIGGHGAEPSRGITLSEKVNHLHEEKPTLRIRESIWDFVEAGIRFLSWSDVPVRYNLDSQIKSLKRPSVGLPRKCRKISSLMIGKSS